MLLVGSKLKEHLRETASLASLEGAGDLRKNGTQPRFEEIVKEKYPGLSLPYTLSTTISLRVHPATHQLAQKFRSHSLTGSMPPEAPSP